MKPLQISLPQYGRLRLRVLYRVFQRFAFRAVFVDLLHVRVDEREVVVIQVLIEEHLERACGGDALGALVGAGQRGAGDEPVKQHERNEQNGEDSARALRDFFDHARHGGVNFFDPDKAERAPDEREHQVCAAVNVEHDSTARMLTTLFSKGCFLDPTMEDQPLYQTQIVRNSCSESQHL